MSEYKTSSGISFKINEDGSITKIGSWNYDVDSTMVYSSRPQIAKMYLSNDQLTCGDTVYFSWSIIDGEECTLTIEQGRYQETYNIPSVGEMNISSDILSDDITLTIGSRNDYGESNSRKTLFVKKRKNDVTIPTGTKVVSTIAVIFVTIVAISRLLDIFF